MVLMRIVLVIKTPAATRVLLAEAHIVVWPLCEDMALKLDIHYSFTHPPTPAEVSVSDRASLRPQDSLEPHLVQGMIGRGPV